MHTGALARATAPAAVRMPSHRLVVAARLLYNTHTSITRAAPLYTHRRLSSCRGRRRSAFWADWHTPHHKPDCTWINSSKNPLEVEHDLKCPGCWELYGSGLQLSRKELEWEREKQRKRTAAFEEERQRASAEEEPLQPQNIWTELMGKDPYDTLFGPSNRRLRGIRTDLYANKLFAHWGKRVRETMRTYDAFVESLTPDRSSEASPKKAAPAKENSEQLLEKKAGDAEPALEASMSWSTSGVKDGKPFASSGRLVYDPITMRMVPAPTASDEPLQTNSEPTEEHKSLQKAKEALESSWQRETAASQRGSEGAKLETAVDRLASNRTPEVDLMKSTLLNMATLYPENSIVMRDRVVPAHKRLEEVKRQALRELSQKYDWTFESLSALGKAEMEKIHVEVEDLALKYLYKQDPTMFYELPKRDRRLQSTPRDKVRSEQAAWEAKANAHDHSAPKTSWRTDSEAWSRFKRGTDRGVFTSEDARHACLSVFRKEKPLRQMNHHELGLHRAKLLRSWNKRHTSVRVDPAEQRLTEEVDSYKQAMTTFETKVASQETSPRVDVADIAGEGDMDVNVADHCSPGKWYKQTIRSPLDQKADTALVQEIQRIYDEAFGIVTPKTTALDNSLDDYEKSTTYDFKASPALMTSYTPESTTTEEVVPRDVQVARPAPVPQPQTPSIQPPNISNEQQAKNVDRLLDMYRKQADGYVETIGRLQRKVHAVQQGISAQQPTLSDKQQAKNVDRLLDMYRKQSDDYVESIGRLQRKAQSLQRRLDQAQVSAPAAKPVISQANPIDGALSSYPRPSVGNFASPTGFVGEDVSSRDDVARRQGQQETDGAGSRPVRREEAVFSGQQPLQKATLQEIIEHLQHRLNETQSPSPPPAGNDSGDTKAEADNKSKPWLWRTASAMVMIGLIGACVSYSLGVLIENYRSDSTIHTIRSGSGQGVDEERGWTAATRTARHHYREQRRQQRLEEQRLRQALSEWMSLHQSPIDPAPLHDQSASGNNRRGTRAVPHPGPSVQRDPRNDNIAQSALAGDDQQAWMRNAAAVLLLPVAGLGVMYAWLSSRR